MDRRAPWFVAGSGSRLPLSLRRGGARDEAGGHSGRVVAEVDWRAAEVAVVGALVFLDAALGLWALYRFRGVQLLDDAG